MEKLMPYVSRRIIGKVNIFDLFGKLEGEWSGGIKSYIESYIRECNFKNVILNIQSLMKVNVAASHDILDILHVPKKTALFFTCPDVMEAFMKGYIAKKPRVCATHQDIVEYFGRDLIERDKVIHSNDRRKHARMKSALACSIDFIDRAGVIVHSQAIVTNLSEMGLFAEYLDIYSALQVENLDYLKNLKVNIKMQNPDPLKTDWIERTGKILRIEFSGSQTGIAIQFNK